MTEPDLPGKSDEWLAARFQEARPRLKALAGRMLGPGGEAEDAVQEAWLRLARADSASIENLGGWLTTVVARVCLDLLRKRKVRGEEELEEEGLEGLPQARNPEAEALLAESVEQAMLLVLDRLAPGERVAFVLHDLFELPFADIALILERSEENARQLASRARRRVQMAKGREAEAAPGGRELVEAFLAASRQGDFSALLRVLAPDVALRADPMAVKVAAANKGKGAPPLEAEIRGAQAVAEAFKGRATGASLALLDGRPGAVWIFQGQVRSAFVFTTGGAKIREIKILMDPSALGAMQISILNK